jgi:hypothetical protein
VRTDRLLGARPSLHMRLKYSPHSFQTWKTLTEFVRTHFETNDVKEHLWVFRGQASSDWKLESALDRARIRLGLDLVDLPLIEEGMVREFQRRASNPGSRMNLPSRSNVLEWLTLMRHYGAPTRLLDWTYTFSVALNFAVEFATTECAVWAVDARWCNRRSRQRISNEDIGGMVAADPYFQQLDTFVRLFCRKEPTPLVYRVNSFALNERLAIQKGLFLCPGCISMTFEENFEALQQEDPSNESHLIKLCIEPRLHKDALRWLHYMNVSRETLFPGLDGLAQSLNARMAIPEVFIPVWRRHLDDLPYSGWK